MRRLSPSHILALLLVTTVVSGCHIGRHGQVVGSGKRLMQKRELPEFTSIATEGAFNIEVTAQKPVSAEVEADDNVLTLVSTEVSNNVLHIKTTSNYSVSEPVVVRLTVSTLQGLSVSGAGKISIAGLKSDKFEIDAQGAPTITVSGETNVIDIDTSGAGKIDTHKLRASKGVVDSKGVAEVQVNAKDELEVTVSGPSHVIYSGDPKLNKVVHGPGSVEKKDSGPS
jgi:hypothetical protein